MLRLYECLESASGAQWELREELDMASPFLTTPGATPTQTIGAPRLALTAPSPKDGPGVDGAWSVSWCKEPYWGPCLAVATATAPSVRVRPLLCLPCRAY